MIRPISIPVDNCLAHAITEIDEKLILLDEMQIMYIPVGKFGIESMKVLSNYKMIKRWNPDYFTQIGDSCLIELMFKVDTIEKSSRLDRNSQ